MKHKPSIMQLRSAQRWIVIVASLLIVLAVPARAFAGPPSPLLPDSPNATQISELFFVVLAISLVVFVVVEGLLIFAIVRYRRKDDDELPEQIHGNNTLEIMWTIVPTGIMVVLFFLTLNSLRVIQTEPTNPMTVQVIGHQWFWEIRYDTGVIANNELRVPVGRPVEIELQSIDVIHSFWVPQLGGKMDAIPGHINTTWFTASDAGTYAGECAEFCGLQHYAMLFDVIAMPQGEFDAWMADKVASLGEVIGTEVPDMTTVPPGDAATGAALYESLGCKQCHSVDGSALVGPSFQGLGNRAAGRETGFSAQQYLAESIIKPCNFVVTGFTCVMPQNFGERVTQDDLANLIAFLLEQ